MLISGDLLGDRSPGSAGRMHEGEARTEGGEDALGPGNGVSRYVLGPQEIWGSRAQSQQ